MEQLKLIEDVEKLFTESDKIVHYWMGQLALLSVTENLDLSQ